MPKRKRKGDTTSKPHGKQYQVLMWYSELPTDVQALKNGHILYQDRVHCHTSKAAVLKVFKDTFNIIITGSSLLSLLTRMKKFKNLAREADDKRFREICDGTFSSYAVVDPDVQTVPAMSKSLDFEISSHEDGTSCTQPVTPLPSVSDEVCTSGTQPVTPLPPESPVLSTSMRSLKRKGLLTPIKKRILEREEEMKKDIRSLKNRVTVLRGNLASKKYIQNKCLQRQVARLYERLRIKSEKLKKREKKMEAVDVQTELAICKRKIRRLKRQHKDCPSKIKFQKIIDENRDLKRKLKEKENTESVLEDRVLQLQGKLQIHEQQINEQFKF